MSALNSFSAAGNSASSEIIRGAIAAHFWTWFAAHQDDQIARVKVVFFSVTIRVRTVRPLFVMLFGEAGAAGVPV
jgi:hypothetical protein